MTTQNEAREPFTSDFTRRDFIKGGVAAGVVAGTGLGAFYFGYGAAVGRPVRVGVIGTGDEGSVLLGALNKEFIEVRSIADIRPYNVHRAFHGENDVDVRPGLMSVYGWKTETEARKHVKVYGPWEDLIKNAKQDKLEGVIIALPLWLHAPVAIAAMQANLHVITEKLMGHTVADCKQMAKVAADTRRHLATGHQRHYNILYAQAAEKIKRGSLGDLHYIRGQWHRSNMPGTDSWQQPLPPGVKSEKENKLAKEYAAAKVKLATARGLEIDKWQRECRELEAKILDQVLHTGAMPEKIEFNRDSAAAQMAERIAKMHQENDNKDTPAEQYGYHKINTGKYEGPALEELIRWRLWNRTAAGLMAELGSHQLDAASIFITAAHAAAKGEDHIEKVIPLSVAAAGNRPIFPPDRDCEDHVYCLIEFPAPDYDPQDPVNQKKPSRKTIGVMYSSINGNGFGGYGETVYGTKSAMLLLREQELVEPSSGSSVKVGGGAGPTMDTQASGPSRALAAAGSTEKVSRGYAEELEHWAWCIRNPAKENVPRCHPKVALGDAVIALVTNKAARWGRRIEFKKEWFDPENLEAVPPEKVEDLDKTAT